MTARSEKAFSWRRLGRVGGLGVTGSLCRLNGVTRSFDLHGQTVPVLRGVDLEVSAGDAVGIRGASGSGKSTLLSILGLIDVGFKGTYAFMESDVAAASESRRSEWRLRALGIAFQDLWLVESLTALENLLVPQFAAGVEPATARSRAATLLEAAGLGSTLDHRPSELSGGERRRVAVARALANRPGLLLVDEPTAELDDESSRRVLDLLNQAQAEGAALVAASHDREVLDLCRTRLVIRDGRLVPDM